MADPICKPVPSFPADIASSQQYRDRFNEVAAEIGLPFRYAQEDPKGLPNIPEYDRNEFAPADGKTEAWKAYQGQPNFKSVLTADTCKIRTVIEDRRAAVSKAAYDQFQILPSPTFNEAIMKTANAAEREWLKRVSGALKADSLNIYALQARHDTQELLAWTARNELDPASQKHFERIRDVGLPRLRPAPAGKLGEAVPALKDPKVQDQYANAFPWLPAKETYSAMLPEDMNKEELAYVMQNYSDQDPIRLPWTVVEEAPVGVTGRSVDGKPVSWIVAGLNGKRYLVTNIAHHPTFRRYFLNSASVLRKHADISVDGQKLNPQFREYTMTMARAFETGDFVSLLKADLDQTEGSLFLTYFPHEGYWADGVKFPISFSVGIRDAKASVFSELEAAVIQGLEKRSAEVALESSSPYEVRPMNTGQAGKSAVLHWQYQNGGFLRAYAPGEPQGHDYPKRDFAEVEGHRNVLLLDAIYARKDADESAVAKNPLISPEESSAYNLDDVADFLKWHEITHGVGARPATKTNSGRTVSQVYGEFFGLLIEPLADAGAFVALGERQKSGLLSQEDFNDKSYTMVTRTLFGVSKSKASDPKNLGNSDYAHQIGKTAFIGYLVKAGALKPENSRLTMDSKMVLEASARFFDTLTRFSFTDDREGFLKFIADCVQSVPDDLEKKVKDLNAQRGGSYLIDRNSRPAK